MANNGYVPRRGVTLKRVSRAPIPVKLTNPDNEDDVLEFDIKSSAVFSPREHKLVQNYIQAAIEFQTIPDGELVDRDYTEMERMLEDAIAIATDFNLGQFRNLDFEDRLTIVTMLTMAYSEANENRMDGVNQMRGVQQREEGEDGGGNFFRRMMGSSSKSSKPRPTLVGPTEDEYQIG